MSKLTEQRIVTTSNKINSPMPSLFPTSFECTINKQL